MVEKDAHEEKVRPGKESLESAGGTHGPRLEEIGEVVCVSGDSPPARSEQKRVVLLSIGGVIFAADERSRFSPDSCISILSSNGISLVVGRAEHRIARETRGEQPESLHGRQVCWITSQILRLKRVESRKERGVAPSQHEAEMVMSDVHRASIPVFVEEEVDDVDGLENQDDEH